MIMITTMTMSTTMPPAPPPAIAPVVRDDDASLRPPGPSVLGSAGLDERSGVSACVSGVDGEIGTAVGT